MRANPRRVANIAITRLELQKELQLAQQDQDFQKISEVETYLDLLDKEQERRKQNRNSKTFSASGINRRNALLNRQALAKRGRAKTKESKDNLSRSSGGTSGKSAFSRRPTRPSILWTTRQGKNNIAKKKRDDVPTTASVQKKETEKRNKLVLPEEYTIDETSMSSTSNTSATFLEAFDFDKLEKQKSEAKSIPWGNSMNKNNRKRTGMTLADYANKHNSMYQQNS